MSHLLTDERVYAVGWTLIHFLWQGTLIALALELVLFAMRGRSSEARYLVRCGGLAAMVIAPVITFFVLGAGVQPEPVVALTLEEAAAAYANTSGELWLVFVVAGWGIGAIALNARLLTGYLRVLGLVRRRAGTPLETAWQERFDAISEVLGVRAVARVIESSALSTPMVIGWLKPVVLLPARVFTGLTQEQIEALIAHELAHVRRHDFIVNLVQCVVEALLFYHPAVWWVSKGIRAEREFCCDDAAVRVTTNRISYARALTTLEGWRGSQVQIGMSTLGGSLMHRIQRLVGVHPSGSRPRGPLSALGVLVVASVVGATAFGFTTPAPGQDSDELAEIRRRIEETQERLDELRAQLREQERATRSDRRLHGLALPRAHEDRDGAHVLDLRGHAGVDLGEIHEHVQEALRDAGIDLDDRKPHRIELHDLDGLGEEIHEHVRKALDEAGIHVRRGRDATHDVRVEVDDKVHVEKLHEHLMKALGHRRDVRKHRIRTESPVRIDLDRLRERSDAHGIDVRHVPKRIELKKLPHLDRLRERLPARVELHGLGRDGHVEKLHQHLRGLHGIDREKLHSHLLELKDALPERLDFRLHGGHDSVDYGDLHEHIQEALEKSEIRLRDGDTRIEVRGLEEAHERMREAFDKARVHVRGADGDDAHRKAKKHLERLFERSRLTDDDGSETEDAETEKKKLRRIV